MNSAIYDIHGPWMVIVGESSAVVVTQVRKDDKGFKTAEDWRTVSIAHMLEFSDIGPKSRGRRKSA